MKPTHAYERTPDLSDQAVIRQAVAFGKQSAVRELLDMLAVARRDASTSGSAPASAESQAQRRAYWLGEQHGLDRALRVVREYRIDPREDPS